MACKCLGSTSPGLAHRLQKKRKTNEDNDDKEAEAKMGWTISVGTAGARGGKGRGGRPQALSVCFDAQGVTAQVKVSPNAGRTAPDNAGSIQAWQAKRVWQNVLSALVGT